MESFARIYSLLMTLENKYGLSPLEKDERSIFNFIVAALAKGTQPTIPDIVEANITSRASTYRHLNNLERAGLIELGNGGHRIPINLSPRFKTFQKQFEKVLKAPVLKGL